MEKNQEGLLAEYNSLRDEINQAIQLTIQTTAVGIPLTAGIIAYAFQTKSSMGFLAIVALILSALWFGTYELLSVRSIAAYIHAVIEPKIEGLQWETIQVLKRRRDKLERGNAGTFFPVVVFDIVSLGCILLAWNFLQDRSAFSLIIYSGITVLLALLLIVTSFIMFRFVSQKYYEKLVREWKTLDDELNHSSSD